MSRARLLLSSRWITAPADSRHLTAIPPPAFVFAYVLSGTVRSQIEGEPLRVHRAGQSWTEPPNSHHLVSANASKTKPARLIAWIIADDGAQATVYDK
jgi:quercetin dioxygenase-like cupin family protein